MARTQALQEAVASLATARSQTKTPGRYRVRIIEADRWGSSAYYPADVLRRDAAVFKAGTHAYFDHPTATESAERPERSLRDLAGRLVTDATFDGDGLYAEMEVFPHYREIVESMADAIGLSIRANGAVEYGEAAGRSGPILTAITEAQSVDFVTAAGAGGRLVQLLESALAERKSWNEGDHPRDPLGKFAHGGGGGSGHSDGGQGGDHRAGRGMPDVIATSDVRLRSGSTLTMARHNDGDMVTLTRDGHSTKLTRDNARTLGHQLEQADDWDTGDKQQVPGVGQIHKASGGQYEVSLEDGSTLNMTRRDIAKYNQTLDDLGGASRVDTGNGDLDVFADGRKVGFRHLGDDGRPVEVVFNGSAYQKIQNTIDRIIDDLDDPDIDNPVRRREVSTNLGKVGVEVFGDWNGSNPGDRLEIMPVDGGDWGIVVDGSRQRAWSEAVAQVFAESRRQGGGAGVSLREAKVRLVEARTIGGWLEARLHLAFTQLADDMYGDGRLTRDERIALSGAIGDALDAFTGVIDEDAPQLYERDLYDGPKAEAAMAARAFAEAAALTSNDLRDALAAAVRDTYGGKDIWTWVRDHTDEWVVFSLEDSTERNQSLFRQTYTLDSGGKVTLTGQPVDVVARTTYEPQPQPASSLPAGKADRKTATGTPPAQIKEGRMPEITEEQAAQLAETATLKNQLQEAIAKLGEASSQITQLTERADAADTKAQRLENDRAARDVLATALAESGIPATSHPGIADSVLRDLPLTESGALDATAFGSRVETAITAKKTELAALLEAAGVGHVRGLGESLTGQAREEITAEQATTSLVESYRARGLSDEAARLAAAGRPY